MPFSRPPLSTLRAQAQADLGSSALLPFSNTRVLADVIAYGLQGLYGYLDWIALQSNPFTATEEYLEAWSALKGVTRKPATSAVGPVTFTGSAGSGATISQGLTVTRADGVDFVTTSSAQVSGSGSVTVTVQCAEPGAASNTNAGAVISLAIAIPGVTTAGASGQLTGGADIETDSELRSRMLLAYSAPAQGGSATDFQTWALDVPGVTRAWVAPGAEGPGTVVIFFMMDDVEAAFNGFPQGSNGVATTETRAVPATGDQLAVANGVQPVQPVTPIVYAFAPTANLINIALSGLSAASATVKAAIQTAIVQAFLSQGSPGGITLANGSPGGVVQLSYIDAAITSTPGSSGFVISSVTASQGSASPTTNISSNPGCLPVLGTLTFL